MCDAATKPTNFSRITEVQQFNFNHFFKLHTYYENKVRPKAEPPTFGYKGHRVNSRPSGKEAGDCETLLKKQVEDELKRVRNVVHSKKSCSRFQDTCSRK